MFGHDMKQAPRKAAAALQDRAERIRDMALNRCMRLAVHRPHGPVLHAAMSQEAE